ncbi:MAG: ArnT family glycosyltransferase [Planctomycetota bacterium]|jgi:hypothetical protein
MKNPEGDYIRKRKYSSLILVFLFLFICQVVLQLAGGAFSNEFGCYPDEAGHYVTGLMVHDYGSDLKFVPPMEFAENYYIHYPKVALGHWPPFFYIVQAFWTLLFSCSRISMMLLTAFITTLLSFTVYDVIRRDFGSLIGIVSGIFLMTLPLVQSYSVMLMAESLVALLVLWSALCFVRFLVTEKWQWSIGFGAFATLAILTKGNGLSLALIIPLALFFSRKAYLVKRLSFWYSLVILILFCGPWYWATLDMVRNGMKEGFPSLGFIATAIPYFSSSLLKIVGLGLFPLVVIGFVVRVIKPYLKKETDEKWATFGALLIGVWLFHIIAPAGLETRHLITVVPVLVIFIVAGFKSILKKLPFRNFTSRKKELILASVFVIIFIIETFSLPTNAFYGYGKIAQRLLSEMDFRQSVMLVSSDERGDGAFISEVAMREQRPGHIVLRATKFLSNSNWDGSEYKLLYSTQEELYNHLHKTPVRIVIIDLSVPEKDKTKHYYLLKETLEAYPNEWELSGSYLITRDGTEYPNALLVYIQKGKDNTRTRVIRLDMRKMLGKHIIKEEF